MKVLNLCCGKSHSFEGWFASEDDYQSQRERGLVECPLCGDNTVAKLPSAPRLSLSGTRGAAPEGKQPMTTEAVLARAVQHVMTHTVDVGDKFAEEARRIHYRETEERGIRGRATPEEVQALSEEGIEVAALPGAAALRGPVQ